MFNLSHNRILKSMKKVTSVFIILTFSFSLVIAPPMAQAQSVYNLPAPGTMITLSESYIPANITGMTIYPNNPLQFDFIIDIGDDHLQGEELRKESTKLINYFMASLTVPEEELWVNLSPYEKDRIIADGLGTTEMGRDMLAQDYILKQLTASLMYPEDEIGKEFWSRIYTKAQEKYGSIDIPTNTFNKIWIVPEEAVLYVNDNNVFVTKSHLKVMLEEDYLALESNVGSTKHGLGNVTKDEIEVISSASAEIIREVLIPEIEREVNEGKNFATLRQIFNSMILATWYKKNLKESLLGQVYVDQNKINGIDLQDKGVKEKIYNQYIAAFKKGVYDYIKEDYDSTTQEIVPRKYFSGGVAATRLAQRSRVENTKPYGLALFMEDRAVMVTTIGKTIRRATDSKGDKAMTGIVRKVTQETVGQVQHELDHFYPFIGQLKRIKKVSENYESIMGQDFIAYEKIAEERRRLGYRDFTVEQLIRILGHLYRAFSEDNIERIISQLMEEFGRSFTDEEEDALRSTWSELIDRLHNVGRVLRLFAGSNVADLRDPALFELEEIISAVLADTYLEKEVEVNLGIYGAFIDGNIAHEIALFEILINLVKNAEHFTRDGDRKIVIRSRKSKVPGNIDIEVEDNGKGISPENLGRIFEPGSTTGEYGGQGIGLAVVKDLVENTLGGNVTVESEVGQGSKFTVSFPVPDHGEKIDLNDAIRDGLVGRVGSDIITTFEEGIPDIRVDRKEIISVVTNLLQNAEDAMPDGGTIKVETSLVESEGVIMVKFSDTGIGITPENLPRIFELDFTHGKEGGTGIGLDHVRSIIRSLGGVIKVESEVGKGTTFTIIFPANQAILDFMVNGKMGVQASIEELSTKYGNDAAMVAELAIDKLYSALLQLANHQDTPPHRRTPSKLLSAYTIFLKKGGLEKIKVENHDISVMGLLEYGYDSITELGDQNSEGILNDPTDIFEVRSIYHQIREIDEAKERENFERRRARSKELIARRDARLAQKASEARLAQEKRDGVRQRFSKIIGESVISDADHLLDFLGNNDALRVNVWLDIYRTEKNMIIVKKVVLDYDRDRGYAGFILVAMNNLIVKIYRRAEESSEYSSEDIFFQTQEYIRKIVADSAMAATPTWEALAAEGYVVDEVSLEDIPEAFKPRTRKFHYYKVHKSGEVDDSRGILFEIIPKLRIINIGGFFPTIPLRDQQGYIRGAGKAIFLHLLETLRQSGNYVGYEIIDRTDNPAMKRLFNFLPDKYQTKTDAKYRDESNLLSDKRVLSLVNSLVNSFKSEYRNDLAEELVTITLNHTAYSLAITVAGANLRAQMPDAAMASDGAMVVANPGGIDFNPNSLNLTEQGEKIEINLPSLNLQDIQSNTIDGILPVIINITPITNFPMLLGISEESEEEELLSQLN